MPWPDGEQSEIRGCHFGVAVASCITTLNVRDWLVTSLAWIWFLLVEKLLRIAQVGPAGPRAAIEALSPVGALQPIPRRSSPGPGLIQSPLQASLPVLSAWVEVGGITPPCA
jgi:hypothetical protein